jgi:hypothetical protein
MQKSTKSAKQPIDFKDYLLDLMKRKMAEYDWEKDVFNLGL